MCYGTEDTVLYSLYASLKHLERSQVYLSSNFKLPNIIIHFFNALFIVKALLQKAYCQWLNDLYDQTANALTEAHLGFSGLT